MITNNDIADAVAALVEKAFPGEKLYRDFTPSGFERPSNLLEISGGKFYPNAGCGAVELRPQFTLTTFVEVDPYHQQDDQELTRRQMTLLGLFLPGYVKVRDRAPRVLDEGEMENGLDFAAVTVTLSYTLDRREFMDIQQTPDMGRLHIRQEVTTNG
ncbi:MAG: hypothetical protein HFF26_02395 [Oscillospiraceae bacterium]|nr:hypothetical protein [Oscillospiraceae bacterium]